ncbi:MAG: hypothetical protein AB7K37_11805 [Cyclobacteriaceae bacterium]
MRDNNIVYLNTYNDLYYSGYNEGAKLLMTFLTVTDYGYYSTLRLELVNRLKKTKTEAFQNYDIAEFYDGGLITWIAGTDQKKNEFAILTIVKIDK